MLKFRMAGEEDSMLLYTWSNDETVRANSYGSEKIAYDDHMLWFNQKIKSNNCWIYIFSDENNTAIGQVRFERNESKLEAVIGIIVSQEMRGKGYGRTMLKDASDDYLRRHPEDVIKACIMVKNKASFNSFTHAGYNLQSEEIIKEIPSYILIKRIQ